MVKRVPYLALAFGVKAEMPPTGALPLYRLCHHCAPIDIWVDIAPKRGKIEKKCISPSTFRGNDTYTLQ